MVVFQSHHRQACMEMRLVLESARIGASVQRTDGQWLLLVDDVDAQDASREIAEYRQDNPSSTTVAPLKRPAAFEFAGWGVMFYALTIISIGALASDPDVRQSLFAAGQNLASDVTSGQWYRVITALTLHVDSGHLLSNLMFGTVFGFLAGRVLGGGVAWLLIVLAGGLGNLVSSLLRDPNHLSVGASTGVFAALGILTIHALRPRSAPAPTGSWATQMMRRWSPLIGGVVLLGLLGTGGGDPATDRTDVGAHLTGFLAGLVVGAVVNYLPDGILARTSVQMICGTLAMGLVIVAWGIAIAS